MLVCFALVEKDVDLGRLEPGDFQIEAELELVEKSELRGKEFEIPRCVLGQPIIGY